MARRLTLLRMGKKPERHSIENSKNDTHPALHGVVDRVSKIDCVTWRNHHISYLDESRFGLPGRKPAASPHARCLPLADIFAMFFPADLSLHHHRPKTPHHALIVNNSNHFSLHAQRMLTRKYDRRCLFRGSVSSSKKYSPSFGPSIV